MIRRVAEVFSGQPCIRLENESLALWASTAVGPRKTLLPGESINHSEKWTIHKITFDAQQDEAELLRNLSRLGLNLAEGSS
jgi:hypothetical protein